METRSPLVKPPIGVGASSPVSPAPIRPTNGQENRGMPPFDTSKPTLQSLGNYDILAKLAEGGMGAVYKGRSRATGEFVAIKVLPPLTARNPVLVKRFQQEFSAAHQLDHPNIVKAIEYCGGASPFLVM